MIDAAVEAVNAKRADSRPEYLSPGELIRQRAAIAAVVERLGGAVIWEPQ